MPWVNTETMSLFLSHTAKEFAGDFCILFLDCAGWHIARDLHVPCSMKLAFLPPYSPELNPVEHIWDHLRENYFKNRAFDSLDMVENTLVEALRSLDGQPDVVRSLTNFHWLNTLCMMYN
jgi:transposase